MHVSDVIILSTINRILLSVAGVAILVLYARWWSWGSLCCVWKLPNLS